jgi:type VI secretion system protein ImpF
MPRDEDRPVQESVLDRLIGGDGAASNEEPSRAHSVRQLKAAVRRDLEGLLNTRAIAVMPPEELSELNSSLYIFGVPDVTSLSADDPRSLVRLRQMITQAINLFEPRLGSVQVSEAATGGTESRQFHFSIIAVLKLDPSPEQVSFDTVFDVASGQYAVKGESNAR